MASGPGAMRYARAATLALLAAPTMALRPRVIRVCPSAGRPDDSQLHQLLTGHTAAGDTIELATLSAAQSAARVLRQQRPDDPDGMIEVVLCPEVHALHSPLRFTAQDHHQVWRAEKSSVASRSKQNATLAPTLSAAVHLRRDSWARVPSKTQAFESPIPVGVVPFRHLWRSGANDPNIRLKRTTLEGTNGTCGDFNSCTLGMSPIDQGLSAADCRRFLSCRRCSGLSQLPTHYRG